MFAEVLKVPEVSAQASFFDLGGHSLLATQAIARIRATLAVDLPLRSLFEASSVTELAARVEAALRAGQGVEAPPIVRLSRAETPPLSFAQERLWFLDQLNPGDSSYNIPMAMQLTGALDRDALGRALDALCARHEVLRTTFGTQDGRPVPIIHPEVHIDLPVTTLAAGTEAERALEARREAAAEAGKPFDLQRGPLLRARLIDLGEGMHLLVLTMHHIVSDGRSVDILREEVTALYEAFQRGEASPLPELPVQYADFAAWQRKWLHGEVMDRQLGYWRDALRGAPQAIDLPADRPRPIVPSHRGARTFFTLSPELSQALRALARKENATLFMILLAAYDVLLHRYTGQDDILVGSPIAGRTSAATEGLIGFFVNTLVLRGRFAERATFVDLLRDVREACLGAYAHQDVPFERLVAELATERDMTRAPLVQVVFSLQNVARDRAAPEGQQVTKTGGTIEDATAKFDLLLVMVDGQKSLSGHFEYARDLFDTPTIERMTGHFLALLEAAVKAPEAEVAGLPMLAEAERQTLLSGWNATFADYPREQTLHGLFEQKAHETPEATALLFEGQSIDYRSLNEEANRLAHHLRSLGAGKGMAIGICVERSPAMVVALLAVLKTGAAYVPLDPTYPRERLALMVEISRATILVTQEKLLGALPSHGLDRISIDRAESLLAGQPTHDLALEVDPWDIAYVMYTSGSTGAPKGVAGTHTGMVNRLTWMWSRYPFQPGEVCCQKTTLSFGDSIWEIFGPLLQGVPAVLIPSEILKDTRRFVDALAEHRVSRLVLVPSLLRAMLDTHADLGHRLPELRTWTTSGEALPAELCRRFLAELPGRVLLNLYGSSEVSADATCYVPESAESFGARVPIGKPIANVQVYVLDARKEPVPVGVSGEIYVGGAGIARGYWQRPDLTVERFLPDPFLPGPRALLFKTGDLGRYLPNGDLEYLGRADLQVKVRGFRIELGEVESAITQHPSVEQAVVMARDYGDADRRLVAYVVRGEGALTTGHLRAFVKERLPEYMVPSIFVLLERLPLTPSGKVDRKALPAPEGIAGEKHHVPPRSSTEEAIVAIFAELLKIPKDGIGALDGFFELGGHSLLATQTISRIRSAFGVELPLRTLFEASSPAELGKRVDEARTREGTIALPPLVRATGDGPRPLSFAQERLWFLDQLNPGDISYNTPVAMQLGGTVDRAALGRALTELYRRHETLRTTFSVVDGSPVQIIHPPAEVPLPVTSVMSAPAAERFEAARRAASAESNRPFDLARGPLFRALLVEIDPSLCLLVLTMHHIVSDGWSLGILQREVGDLYDAFRRGEPSPLPELPVQYADYAAWQRAWLEGEILDRQLGYWRDALRGAPQALDLPADRPRPPVPTYRGGRRAFRLSPALSKALTDLAQRENVTLFMLLLAAFEVLLHRYTGQDDLVVGSPIAGRTVAETEGLIGFFVNTLVLRAQFPGDLTFQGLLAQVRETCLGAYAHQDLPFERLVAEMSPERDPSRSPLFQVMFLLQAAAKESGEREGASGSRRGATVENATTKFDILLVMIEGSSQISGIVEYALDLFEPASIDRMMGHFETLLDGIAERPSAPIWDLPLLPASERALLARWNDTAMEFPRASCLHELVEAAIDRAADATALVDGHARVSYVEMERRANQLAHALRRRGVGPDVLVAVCLRRSASMVIALLAILKAGGAYVPLDPAYPTARLGQILDDASVRVVISEEAVRDVLPAHGGELLLLDRDAAALEAESASRPERLSGPKDLANVRFTSGSTGRPKGVAIEHHSPVCLIHWAKSVYGHDDVRGVLLATSICFDLSVFEIFLPLASGTTLVIAENALSLPSLPARQEVTLVNTVPTAIAALVRSKGLPSSVRVVCLAGEPLSAALVEQIYAVPTVERVYNLYGPTEDTTYSTYTLVPRGAPVTVGRPIANGQAYLFDPKMRPVPIGVPGEIFLGGEGLARGYLGRPDLTAERFIDDPWHAGERLYRTSDLGRYRADGEIEYLGRIDHQVKVRGFRIELGEIELCLLRQPAVREVVVVAREDLPGDKRLVAYLSFADDKHAGVHELRAFVAERLPDFMVPQAFVVLERLPLTPNGKIDRKALPAPDLGESSDAPHVAPRSPVEEALVGLYAEVLRLAVEAVGVHHGFFELGGHSLLATQLVSRIRATFGVELPLRAVFEASSPAELGHRVESAMRGGAAHGLPPIEREAAGRERPLSFAQERLWFLDQLNPGDTSYNLPLGLHLTGSIDIDALGRALSALSSRHEALRTTFTTVEGFGMQVIHEPGEVELPVVSLSSLPVEEREAEARRLANEEAARPFDLGKGPLFRARLFAIDAQSHLLVLTMHHIVSDGWSVGVLGREVSALYDAFRQGKPSPLAPLPVQYADFAAWQRRVLAGDALDRELAHWTEALAGAPRVIDLPVDRPHPALPSHRGARKSFTVAAETARALTALAAREQVTSFMLLLAAFDVLLHRYSGQASVLVGTPVAGRGQRETESLIGFFVNTLVLRADVQPDLSFVDLLRQVRETCLTAYGHAELPFERLVQKLAPERDLRRSPLFQVMFLLQPAAAGKQAASKSRRGVTLESATAKFDLTLTMTEGKSGLGGSFEYALDIFDEPTIDRMIGHFQNLLDGIARDPALAASALPLLGEREREHLVFDWNATQVDYPTGARVSDLFEAAVDRDPEAIAVRAGARLVSYRELDEQANRLAHRLQALGVGPDVLVGVCLSRSVELVISVLAVLKAGGAYVPLDPTYPRERLDFMIEDAGVPVLLTTEEHRSLLPEGSAWVLAVDTIDLSAESAARSPCPASPESLCYVIYTSGSTGRPKGAMLEHRGVVNYLSFAIDNYRVAGGTGSPVHSSIGFDLTVTSLFTPLLSGRTVTFVSDERGVLGLADALRDGDNFSLVKLTPSHLEALGSELEQTGVRGKTRALIIGGEALFARHLEIFRRDAPETRLINEYGPTETVVGCAVYEVPEGPLPEGAIPIGRPIANSRLYVLDPRHNPVPIGVTGEIYIAGAQVGRGYLNRPELTAERFLPDPFVPGERMYRSGDLGRHRADGELEYLGRVDHQVKVRGFRIELGEIESVLVQHPDVREAAVLAREDSPGQKRLVAYLAAAPGTSPGDAELREFLGARLPEYMVPAVFVVLDAMPLTDNGKIDRAALPAPESKLDEAREIAAPRNEIEQKLVEIWASVLRLKEVGIHDNFFAVGGDSILGIHVVSRAQKAGLRLTPQQIFRFPTIAGLAAVAETVASAAEVEGRVTGPVRLSPIASWWVEQGFADPHHWNQAVMLEAREALDPAALEQAVLALIEHHDALRLRVDLDPLGAIQTIAEDGGPAPFRRVDLQQVDESERVEALRREVAEAQSGLDLTSGPIVRVVCFDLGPAAPSRLLVVVHHIAVDGVSWRIILEDLWSAYESARRGEPPALPPRTTSIKRWAMLLGEHARSAEIWSEQAYWLDDKRRRVGRLPADHPAGENLEGTAKVVSLALSKEHTESLLRDVPEVYGTQINDVLLAAFAIALRGLTGEGAVLFDLEGHGREELFPGVDLTRTVGWFTSLFPVVLDVGTETDLGWIMKSVKEQLRAIPRRGIGYGLLRYLREEPEIKRALAAIPEAEIVFNYLGQLGQSVPESAPLRPAREGSGAARSPRARRAYQLEINASVVGGRLQVGLTYGEAVFERSTVLAFAESFLDALRALIAHCLSGDAGGYTASDFQAGKLSQNVVDMLTSLGDDDDEEDDEENEPR
ncbi:MAG: amino acid adenylation domain-containing protein [Byssovorax sp.]